MDRDQLVRPTHFSVKNDGSTLRISFRWIWRGFINIAIGCFGWNSIIVLFYWFALRTGGRMMWLAVIWGIPHVGLGLLLLYATLARLVNHTVIKVTSDSLTVGHGPLPWWGNRSLPIDQLERLECQKDTTWGFEAISSKSVIALTKAGSKVDLVTGLDSATQALFIKQEVHRWLKIDGSGAGGEVGSHS